ncbi:precorrin-6A/cobalt-precorrin-6A reductase [Cognatishimia sp. F0-27]|uniref:precorrin-6A/cobalt-precorrin-6A reductase n=1 Tax=Cognatishimia sp. F0-27 TaxID=2816855 RepID=UPI001D0C0326|nr:precorrin-6A/cobalt-precorrin-6A reductase [Cognatishimia sp. F0-27]MCC1491625.1 precorrin-6A/cobalt-precorrin-6A reductase [Cognatishimia sp. F0-27]
MGSILIIAGSAEAFALSQSLPQASVRLAARERVARGWAVPPQPLRDADFEACPDAVIEAAHPVDTRTAERVAEACRLRGLRHCQLVRPPWRATRADRWHRLRRPEDAAAVIPEGARVLATLGRAELPRLKALRARLFVRRLGMDPDHDPIGRGQVLRGQGPFSVAEEIALLRRHRIDWILSYNAGGPGGWPKLAAARALGIDVALIDRPRRPDGPRVRTIKEAVQWVTG